MNHRQILDRALVGLPAAKAAYLLRVADMVEQREGLEDRRHLLYPVLAAAVSGIETVLEPQEVADTVVDLVMHHGEGIAATLYAPAYLRQGLAAMAPWAERLQAELAVRIFDRMASGQLRIDEPKVWRFRTDTQDGPAFPFADEDGD
ncbi:hypothetical protein [Oleisolibacter albus]|uniref:hypothetical protein n=1 Tax=Oleisolibacter albus TaxID=2171757 RepID=UPI000DF41BCA|nr:hypothetical protein [Oleisolibacter albus]